MNVKGEAEKESWTSRVYKEGAIKFYGGSALEHVCVE